jgi:hypothetical protein
VLTNTSSPKLMVPQLSVAISGLARERPGALVEATCPTAPPVEVCTMTSVFAPDGVDGGLEELARLRGRARLGVAHVQVHDARAGLAAARRLVGNFLEQKWADTGVCSRVTSAPTSAAVSTTSRGSAGVTTTRGGGVMMGRGSGQASRDLGGRGR